MKAVLVLFALSGCVLSIAYTDVLEAEWNSFKLMHGKSYADANEELLRKQIFIYNKKLIDAHNARFEAGEVTHKMGVNQFTDMRHQEFVASMMGSRNTTDANADNIYIPPANLKIPNCLDWRNRGAVSRVKQQAPCGSCWAFAAVATLESQYFIKTNQMVELSEQNLLDCSSIASYKNTGCKGGAPKEALRYVEKNGINSRISYPYEARQNVCRFDKKDVVVKIKGTVSIPFGDERALQAAVANKGPISVTIDAKHLGHYQSGIYNQPCSGTPVYHSILLVGYGTDDSYGLDYWLLKNSWGENWGECGYFRMARNSHNLCYIANWAVFPQL